MWFRWEQGGWTIDWLRPAGCKGVRRTGLRGHGVLPAGALFEPNSRRAFRVCWSRDPASRLAAGRPPFRAWPRLAATLDSRGAQKALRVLLRYSHQPDAWPWRYDAEQEIALVEVALEIRRHCATWPTIRCPQASGSIPISPRPPQRASRQKSKPSGRRTWTSCRRVALQDRSQAIDVTCAVHDNVFTGRSRRAHIVWPERNAALDLESDAPLDFLVLYTPPGEPFFCAEPMNNVTDAFNLSSKDESGTGLFVLAPGGTCTATTRFVPHVTKSTYPQPNQREYTS